LLALLAGQAAMMCRAELIKFSLLNQQPAQFTCQRNIFSLAGSVASNVSNPPPAAQAGPASKTSDAETAAEISRSLIYEGYTIKDSQKAALLNLGGQYYIVVEGDVIEEKIKIISIKKEAVTITYENHNYEVPLKGDENE
jgi:hypothetical protein